MIEVVDAGLEKVRHVVSVVRQGESGVDTRFEALGSDHSRVIDLVVVLQVSIGIGH